MSPLMNNDAARFITLRKKLTELRAEIESSGTPMTQVQRDVVAIAQAEALADMTATLNSGISVSTN